MLKGLPKLLLALSQESTLDPGLSGRLFMVASEIEFYGVLLSLETEREESAEEDNTDSATAAIDRVRQELENVAADGTGTDVALLRKRLNEALDEADSEDSALEEILTRVTETSEQIEVERSNLDHLVAMARERGASWNKIARAVGISAQSAHKRWDPEARAKARKYMQDYSVRRRDA
jgi:transposase-like protein